MEYIESILSPEDITKYQSQITDWSVSFVPRFIFAIVVLVIGLWVAKRLTATIQRGLERANVAAELISFFGSVGDLAFKGIAVLLAASILGFQVSSLLGLVAAIGFAVGMAMQGFLGNFASGITIIFFKPYRVGDWVSISDKFGRVSDIHIFNTTIVSPGQKTLVIPNGKVTDDIITNFSTEGKIKLDLTIGMAYQESFPKVKSILLEALKECEHILQEHTPDIGILEFDSHTVTLTLRPTIDPDKYWEATYEANAKVKAALSAAGIQMAYSEGVELGPIGE